MRIPVAVSFIPHLQPQGIWGPGGRPLRQGFTGTTFPSRRGRNGHSVKCLRIWVEVSLAPHFHPHTIRGPGDRPMRLTAVGSRLQISTRSCRQECEFPTSTFYRNLSVEHTFSPKTSARGTRALPARLVESYELGRSTPRAFQFPPAFPFVAAMNPHPCRYQLHF